MPPLAILCRARNPSSVCTRTSKMALPIPRTSYLASVIHRPRLRRLRKAAAYHKRRCYRSPMIWSFLTVFSGTLASRLLGFLRDSLIAALLGTGAVADAFLAAFQLVNVIRRLLTEGALNAALVPAWLRLQRHDGAAAAAAFAGRVLGTVSAGLIAATILLAIAMPQI